MALPNPAFVDANARHDANVLRALGELVSEGQEGVRGPTHLAVKALGTPGGAVTVGPGVYSVKNTAAGGSYENYIGKVLENEQVSVSPTDSSGPRTDLVILRIENPYVAGTGTWAEPASPADGPYAHVRVIEGVAANTQTVRSLNSTWTAITLARITRPASTGIVTQAHITDLRSMIDLTVERIVVINNPPATPPPIATEIWSESTPCQNAATIPSTQTGSWAYFPLAADWQVPVPSWALGMDIHIITNPQVTGDVWGGMRLVIDEGGGTVDSMGVVPADYDVNYHGGPGPERFTHIVGGTATLASRHRGKVVRMRLQVRSYDSSNHSGHLAQERGTRVGVILVMKRFPITSDGG